MVGSVIIDPSVWEIYDIPTQNLSPYGTPLSLPFEVDVTVIDLSFFSIARKFKTIRKSKKDKTIRVTHLPS